MGLFNRKKEEARTLNPTEAAALREEAKNNGAVSGYDVIKEKIGKEQIRNARILLEEYKRGKANLEARIIDNEQWFKLRHWEQIKRHQKPNSPSDEPSSAWLFNSLANKHADAMDNYPEPNILPREESDKQEAKMLSSIIPVVLEQNDFEQVYNDVWWYKLKTGTGVYGVFWNKSKLNGLGDIDIRKVDIINLFWESGISDIQDSPNLFHVELVNNDVLEATYPDLVNRLGSPEINVKKYLYDDAVDTSKKSAVIDWYYKKNINGKTVLHYCKFVNDVVLYATENVPEFAERGLYDHAKYPFIFDTLFVEEGTPCGFGYLDICKNPQMYIDKLNSCIIKNAIMTTTPRFFIQGEGGINEDEFADWSKPFIHVQGTLGEDALRQLQMDRLDSIYVSVLNNKIEELKETSGNRDVNSGGTASGVTAASAIAALQETGNKQSRDMIRSSYRAFREINNFVIELIRQFYDVPRSFRIIGEQGMQEFVLYDNRGIIPQAQGMAFGQEGGYRVPEFDIEVSSQKSSPYNKMANNELALQLYQLGFFNPQMCDQALSCLDMMDFDGKTTIMQKVQQNGNLYQQVQMLQEKLLQVTAMISPEKAGEMAMAMQGQAPKQISGSADIAETNSMGEVSKEHGVVEKARQKAADGSSPV